MATVTAPPPPRVRPAVPERVARAGLSHRHGFWAVAFAFLVAMGYSAVPTPLYGLYAARDGFGSLTVTIVFATYAVGVILSLFVVGHLSDWHGRRRLLLPALAVGAASTVVFLLWQDLPGLLVARFVSGLSIGAVTATATAWLAELHAEGRPVEPARRADVVAISANLGGIGLGPLVAGALAQWVGHPLTVPFLVFGGLQLVALAAVALTPETRRLPKYERPRYRPQRIHVPAAARAPFAAALGAGFLSFATFALFTSLAPAFLAGSFGHPSHALAGAAAFVVFFGAVIAQLALARRPPAQLVLVGTAGIVLGSAAIVAAVWLASPSLALFLAGGMVLGTGAGAIFTGSLATIVRISEPARRAETLAGLFLASYLGLVIPALGMGLLVQQLAPKVALAIFGAVVVTGILASLRTLLRAAR